MMTMTSHSKVKTFFVKKGGKCFKKEICELIDRIVTKSEKTFVVTIKEHKRNRSLMQNNTMWMWEADIAKETGYPYTSESDKAYFHEQMLMAIYGAKKVKLTNPFTGNVIYTTRPKKRTSEFNVEQMTDHLRLMQAKAEEMGWALRHPDDYAYIMMLNK